MNIETLDLDVRRTHDRPCGMMDKPYARKDKCKNPAAYLISDASWHIYQNYRLRFNKYHNTKALPVLLQVGICEDHLKMIGQLPEDPKASEEDAGVWRI